MDKFISQKHLHLSNQKMLLSKNHKLAGLYDLLFLIFRNRLIK